jgi:two-component system, NarL family, sensor histidine kinase LiaS
VGSIRIRLLIISLSTTLLAASTVIAIAYFEDFGDYLPQLRGSATSYLAFKWQGGKPSAPLDTSFMDKVIAQGYIIDADERVLYGFGSDSPKSSCQVGSRLEQCFVTASSPSETGHTLQLGGERYFDFREPLQDGNSVVARLNLNTPLEEFRQFLESFWHFFRLIVITAVPIALLLSFAIARPVIRRLHRMSEASKQFAKGDMAVRTNDSVPDEIGQVGRQFDAMAQTISSQLQQLRQLAEENSQLALVSEKNARLAERASLSRDLHDSVSQHLFSLAMGTSELANQIRRNPDKAAIQAEQLADIAAKAQDELRSVLMQLRPVHSKRGLLESLLSLVAEWRVQTGLSVQTQLQPLRVPMMLEDVIYRVTQEAFNNISRHANAKSVTVSLEETQGGIQLLITDDGRGFEPEQVSSGLGLLGMRERVQSVGGSLTLGSGEAGTRLCAKFPFAKENMQKINLSEDEILQSHVIETKLEIVS